MDGTLLDSMGLWLNAGKYYLEGLGKKAEDNLGEKLLEMNMAEGALYLQKNYGLSLSVTEISRGINETLKKNYAENVCLKSGVLDFLTRAREKHIKTAICTNTDRLLFAPGLERLGLYKYFDEIVTCSEEHTSKAKPDIFFSVAKKLKSAPERTVVFEDALYALKTARNAGFLTCGVFDKITQSYTDPEKIRHFSNFYLEDWSEAERVLGI